MNEHVISFGEDGSVVAMHNDKFDLAFLGHQTITRASDIRFDETAQSWGVWLAVAERFVEPLLVWSTFTSYEEARGFEVRVLNLCREAQCHPVSCEGAKIAWHARGWVEKLQA